MADKAKKVGEIFSDYKTNSNIKYAEVRGLNVVKKTSTLEVILYFDEYIEIKVKVQVEELPQEIYEKEIKTNTYVEYKR